MKSCLLAVKITNKKIRKIHLKSSEFSLRIEKKKRKDEKRGKRSKGEEKGA